MALETFLVFDPAFQDNGIAGGLHYPYGNVFGNGTLIGIVTGKVGLHAPFTQGVKPIVVFQAEVSERAVGESGLYVDLALGALYPKVDGDTAAKVQAAVRIGGELAGDVHHIAEFDGP